MGEDERLALGRKRQAMRTLAGLSVPQLAERAGLDGRTVRDVERGGNCNTSTLHALANALGVTWVQYAEPTMPDVPVAS